MADTKFHKSHEILADKIYNNPTMLPDRYVFVITNLCNLNCDFCFQDKKPRQNAMSADDWINLAKQLPDYARVTITGGEPLIFPEFKKVFSYIAERFNCNIITNGLLLNEEIIDYLLSFPKFKVLSLSIDNIGNTNRGVRLEQWERLEKMLRYFLKKKQELNSECNLDVKTMVLDENANELFEIYKYLVEKIGIDTHAFQFLKAIQHADTMYAFEDILNTSTAYYYKNFDTIKEQLELVRQYNLENKKNFSFLHPKFALLTSEEEMDIDKLNFLKHKSEFYSSCKFPWSSVHINVDGTLFPCLAVSMGNVKEKPLKEIIGGPEFTKFKELIKKHGTVQACNRCGWLRLAK